MCYIRCLYFITIWTAKLFMPFFTVKAIITLLSLWVGFLAAISYFCQSPSVLPLKMDLIKNYRSLNKSCFVLGASGESGKALVKELVRLKPFERVVLIGRRKLDYQDEELKKLEQKVINFDDLDKHRADFDGFSVGYCCLGTTLAQSGKDGFVKIEHDYVLGAAKLAKEGGTQHFHLISSTGANENSWFLYQSTKGRTDREVSELGFRRFSSYRPAVIMVDREASRPAEYMLRALMKPIAYIAPTWGNTPVGVMARAMIANTIQEQPPGAEHINNQRIHALGKLIPE